MATTSLEERVKALEAEVALLKENQATHPEVQQPWWEQIRGSFKDDPHYLEAMRLGREYRESQPILPADEEAVG